MKKFIVFLIISITALLYAQTEQSQAVLSVAQEQNAPGLVMPEPPEKMVGQEHEDEIADSGQRTDQEETSEAQSADQPSTDEPEAVSEPQKPAKPTLYPIDKVEAVIFFDEAMKVISSSDVKRNLDGQPRTLEDILNMYVMYDKATNKYKIPVNESTVDKYFSSLQQQHNLTMEQIKEMFAHGGFTYDQGRQELKMMYANNSLLQFLVESRIVVSQEMIKEHHDSHPVFQESKYEIQLASISIPNGKSKAEIKQQIDEYIKTGQPGFAKASSATGLEPSWSDILAMKKDDFADDKKPITDLDVNDIFVQETASGFDLFKLLSKQEERFLPLDKKRYQEIEMKIKEPLFYEMIEKVRQELLDEASIVKPADAQALDQYQIVQ